MLHLARMLAGPVLLLVTTAASAPAQTDHLKCYQMRDPLNLAGTADLNTPQFGGDAGCKISKAKLFCVPGTKTNVTATDKTTKNPITLQPVSGPDPGDRVCYKVKCPIPAMIPDQEVTDQFGTRTLTKFKVSYLCTPAVKGTFQRFVDNGNGTVTDNQTGLQWEQKTGTVGSARICQQTSCPDPHDVNNTYAWSNAGTAPDGPAFTDFLGKLNNCTSSDGTAVTDAGFAGHCDWRLPTIQELAGIIDLTQGVCGGGPGPCIDQAVFGPTVAGVYWSATTFATDPDNAWFVYFGFFSGNAVVNKGLDNLVRAVRSGL
jgi:Protein of unknown function (DUF1566)